MQLPDNLPTPTWCDEEYGVALYCGDCLDIMPGLPEVDAVVTDPPYKINTKSDGMGKVNPWTDYCNSALWYKAWLQEARRLGSTTWSCLNWRSLVTFQKASCDLRWPIESLMVWDKCWIGPGGPNGLRPSYEMVALWCSGGAVINRGLYDIQRFPWSGMKPNGHPAEKPEGLMRFCIKAVEAQSILDPFMGSGTTGVAAVNLGRAFIGIELDRGYFDIAVERIRKAIIEKQDGPLFAEHVPEPMLWEDDD